MVNDFEEAIADFVAMPKTRQIAQPKNFIATNEGAPNRKICLLLNSFFCDCKSNYYLAATISFDCISIPSSSHILKVLMIVCGKILCLRALAFLIKKLRRSPLRLQKCIKTQYYCFCSNICTMGEAGAAG